MNEAGHPEGLNRQPEGLSRSSYSDMFPDSSNVVQDMGEAFGFPETF